MEMDNLPVSVWCPRATGVARVGRLRVHSSSDLVIWAGMMTMRRRGARCAAEGGSWQQRSRGGVGCYGDRPQESTVTDSYPRELLRMPHEPERQTEGRVRGGTKHTVLLLTVGFIQVTELHRCIILYVSAVPVQLVQFFSWLFTTGFNLNLLIMLLLCFYFQGDDKGKCFTQRVPL